MHTKESWVFYVPFPMRFFLGYAIWHELINIYVGKKCKSSFRKCLIETESGVRQGQAGNHCPKVVFWIDWWTNWPWVSHQVTLSSRRKIGWIHCVQALSAPGQVWEMTGNKETLRESTRYLVEGFLCPDLVTPRNSPTCCLESWGLRVWILGTGREMWIPNLQMVPLNNSCWLNLCP